MVFAVKNGEIRKHPVNEKFGTRRKIGGNGKRGIFNEQFKRKAEAEDIGRRRKENAVAAACYSEHVFVDTAQIPARGACIPRPTAHAVMCAVCVNVGGKHIRFFAIPLNVFNAHRVNDGVQQTQNIIRFAVSAHGEQSTAEPHGGVGILPAVFADAGNICADITGIVFAARKRRVEKADNAVFLVNKPFKCGVQRGFDAGAVKTAASS